MNQPPVLTAEQVREFDRCAIEEFHVPGIVLMENAGRSVVDTMCELAVAGPILICCGSGNNAGDGFVMARHLELRGYPVHVVMWSDPRRLGGDAATNYHIVRAAGIPFDWLQGDDWGRTI